MDWVGFWINDPSKIGRFHQHWENFAEMLQFEDLAVKNSFSSIFLWKKSWIGLKKNFLWMLNKKLKTFCEPKGLKGDPFKHSNYLFFTFIKIIIILTLKTAKNNYKVIVNY